MESSNVRAQQNGELGDPYHFDFVVTSPFPSATPKSDIDVDGAIIGVIGVVAARPRNEASNRGKRQVIRKRSYETPPEFVGRNGIARVD